MISIHAHLYTSIFDYTIAKMQSSKGTASSTADAEAVASGAEEPDLSLIIPTLNEEDGIAECIRRARRGFEEAGIDGEIIVSDSSQDSTPRISRELGARVVTPDKPGYGYAYLYAFRYVRGDIIAIGDGDTTYDFTELPRLVNEVRDGADLVIGSRFQGEIESGAMPWLHRRIGNPLLTAFLNLFYRMDVTDAHSGFRVFTREALDAMDPDTNGMELASEMLIRAKASGLDIREVPITYGNREGEATIESFADGWRHLRFLIVHAPGEMFLVPGFFVHLLGAVLMAVTLFDIPPLEMLGVNSMTAGSLLTLVGSHVIALGAFSTLARDPIRNPRNLVSLDFARGFTVERGIVIGLAIFAAGVLSSVYLLWEWFHMGLGTVPSPAAGVLTMTLVALGLQTVFQMFFISLLENVDLYE